VVRYGGQVLDGRVTGIRSAGEEFQVSIGTRTVTARRLLVATGVRDELPDVPGLAERWGIDVLHCPYCHGWEVRDLRIGILATGPGAVHQALLFRQLSSRVTVLRHTAASLDSRGQFGALGIPVVSGVVAEVETVAGALAGVRLLDGTRVPLDAVVVAPRMIANAELLAPLGLFPVEVRAGEQVMGTQIPADPSGATEVPGVWVAGNLAAVQAQVISSAASGLMAGAAINADLVASDARRAVKAMGSFDEHGWDERYRARPEIWSGSPNEALVAEVSDLVPGTALDAGAGEGGDACWLAGRGWKVTAADISRVALERAASRAEGLGLEITWLHADLAVSPAPGAYDLVTAHFLHVPRFLREPLYRHLAAAVAAGGTLLVVGHDFSDMRPELAEMGWTADELAGWLGSGWTVEVAEARPRRATDQEGHEVTVHDAVLRARRDG
jgi:thioredoxin reductase